MWNVRMLFLAFGKCTMKMEKEYSKDPKLIHDGRQKEHIFYMEQFYGCGKSVKQ